MTAKKIALGFDETDEKIHFERIVFRAKGKIFSSLSESNREINLKLSVLQQSLYCKLDAALIHPISGAWGLKGWTTIYLSKTSKTLLTELLRLAYCNVAPLRLSKKYL